MPVPLRYNLRSLLVRKAGTSLSVLSIGLSVGVLVLVLALAQGFELTLVGTGTPNNVIVLRKSATSEGESGLQRWQYRALSSFPGIAIGETGAPLASAEVYAALNLDKSGGGSANFPLRGVMLSTFVIRDTARVAAGRTFTPGMREVVVGKALLGRIVGCRLGGALELQGQTWPVVGVIDSGGGAYDSEIWCDVEVFLQELDRPVYGTASLRVDPSHPGGADALIAAIEADPRFDAKVLREPDYFASQAGTLGTVLQVTGYFIAGIMAVGAAFGTAVTLLASLARRTHEVGTLLAVGFRPREILAGFLVEALVLGLAGGVLGVLLAYPVNGVATGTMNWDTFTEQAFAFRITPTVVIRAVTFSTLVGVLSGVVPAWKASRLPPSEALRR
jgi:putative ABC transport system permease protein